MPTQKSCDQVTIEDLIHWGTNEASIPGMDQETYTNIFE